MDSKEEKQPEYMEVEDIHTETTSSLTLTPRESFPSFYSVQSASISPFSTRVSSLNVLLNLHRSSQSDITNSLHSQEPQENTLNSQKSKHDLFNVSKSFGQFTYISNESNDNVKEVENKEEDSTPEEYCEVKSDLKNLKKVMRPLMRENKKKTRFSCSFWQIIFFLLLPVVVVLISTFISQQQMGSGFCNPSFNLTNFSEKLQKQVHGQAHGMMDLVNYFETNHQNFKIIALVGGTGVGKSHVSNIIKNSMPENFYSFEYFPPLYKKVKQAYSSLSTCQCNLIILENLVTEDISDAAFFTHTLKNHAPDHCIVILALFNPQVMDDNLRRSVDLKSSIANIEKEFEEKGLEVKSIAFETLDEESIMKCITDAIKDSYLYLSEEDKNRVKENLLISNSGCKGAHSKVQLVGKISN